MIVQLLSLATVLIIVILSQSSLYNYIFRGTNQIHSLKETFFNYFYTLIFSFTPILPYYHKLDFSSYFYESGVHDALTTSIFPFPPLGIASILAFLGIILFFKIKKYKKEGYIFLSIFLSLWILGGFAGPSFGRFTLFIPSLIFFATYFIDHFYKNKKVFYPLIIVTLLSSILIDAKLILNLHNNSKMAPYFLPHITKINQFLMEDNTPHKFIVARNYALLIDYLATTKSKVISINTFDEIEYTKIILSKIPSVVIIPQIPTNYIRLYNGEQIFIDSIREKLLACALISRQGYLKDDPKNPVFSDQILGEYYYIEANNCVN